MKLTILGSGTFVPISGRNNPGYLLDIEGNTILIDCGSGTLRQLSKADRSFWEINKVFLSHFHIDHTADLIPLLFTRKYSANPENRKDISELAIHAHLDFGKILESLENIYTQWIRHDERPYKFNSFELGYNKFKDFSVFVLNAKHNPESLLFRFEDKKGRRFVYTGDTGYCQELVEISNNTDLLLCECSLRDIDEIETHLTPGKISRLLEEIAVKKVILTHIYPENDDDSLLTRIGSFKEKEILVGTDFLTVEI